MGELAARIARRIKREGPLSIAAFMAMALHDPEHGYYSRRQPLGRAGDFTTAPEISQIFGELIGLWCADLWQRIGRPESVILAELGPGSGALLADFLRAAETLPEFRGAIEVCLVEASPILRATLQRRFGAAVRFVDGIDALRPAPLFLIANEFLDALPVRQLVRAGNGWAERLVGLDADELVFVDGPEHPALNFLVPAGLRAEPPGTIVEICPAAAALAATLGARLAAQPGAALFIDYGSDPSAPGPTLAAIRRHRAAAVLDAPGESDLSAHVDFAQFAAAAATAGAVVHGPVTQRHFLWSLGAAARLAALSAGAEPKRRAALESGLSRLLDPAQMGTLFKVLALTSPGLPTPAGFERPENDHPQRP